MNVRLMQKLTSVMAEAEIKIRELCELVKAGAACTRTPFVHNKVSSVWQSGRQGNSGHPARAVATVYGW